MSPSTHTDDLHRLLGTLPPELRERLESRTDDAELLEIVMDLGRPAEARYPGYHVSLLETPVSQGDLAHVIAAVGEFGSDNRAGIEGTLHRISALRNRTGHIVGLTLRVGRTVVGTIGPIRDLVESGTSLLLLGRPGVGKTTRLREVARVLADEFDKRVIVIDTSNEIAGDGDVPHPAIGSARRMQVPRPEAQHAVMIEAVENHMPEVIIVDEIGTALEALAARTIAERGVQLVGTAHGTTLENLVSNPTLSDLVGGVQTVTLGDEEARLRGTQKAVSERKGPPTFDAVVEILGREELKVHPDTAGAVDRLLRGRDPGGIRRGIDSAPASAPPQQTLQPSAPPAPPALAAQTGRPLSIYPYAVSRDLVERAIRTLGMDARTVRDPERAQVVIALRSRAEDPRLAQVLQDLDRPLYLVKKSTTAQLRHLLQDIATSAESEDPAVVHAMREAEDAARRVLREGGEVELAPQPSSLRRLQHRVAVRHRLVAESVGSEPQRHLVIHG